MDDSCDFCTIITCWLAFEDHNTNLKYIKHIKYNLNTLSVISQNITTNPKKIPIIFIYTVLFMIRNSETQMMQKVDMI